MSHLLWRGGASTDFSRLLSGVKITDEQTLAEAIHILHQEHRVPHVVITSVRFGDSSSELSVIGSSARSDMSPRLFKLSAPALPVFFSGTGDMFAALMVARLREACGREDLLSQPNWQSPDEVKSAELPLATAAETVLASMHAVLEKTMQAREESVRQIDEEVRGMAEGEKKRHLRLTKAAEVRVVRNVKDLLHPPETDRFKAKALEVELSAKEPTADGLGVVKTGLGGGDEGAAHQT